MAEVTDVDIASGIPTGGTGTVPTLSKTNTLLGPVSETAPGSDTASSGINGRLQRIAQRLTSLMADGGLTTLGAKTDAKSTATDATSITAMQVFKQISASIQAAAASLGGTLTVAAHAVTQSGSWVLSAGTALIGKVTINDGTNSAVVRAGSSAAVAGDAALVVAVRPDSLRDNFAEYETVAAGQTDQVLGPTGASGDYLAGVLIVPAAAAAGAVSIKDGAGSSITIFAGGGTVALPTLAPIFVPLGIYSTSGAWKITTGSNVSAIGVGDFT
jgi:hypothetical protein